MSATFISFRPAAITAIEAAAMKQLNAAANIGRNRVVENLAGTRSGRTYKVPGTNRTYTASAPGEYPAVATGRLRGDIKTKVVPGAGYIGTNVEYAPVLEDDLRPFLKRSLDEASGDMKSKLMERWF